MSFPIDIELDERNDSARVIGGVVARSYGRCIPSRL